MIKWITAFIGYYLFRFPGGVFGFFIGSLFEQFYGGKRINFNPQSQNSQPAFFQINLISLAAIVIKADGKVKAAELQFVRSFFITNYGAEKAASIFEIFNEQIKKEAISIPELVRVFRTKARYETQLQILHFLFGVANADGSISKSELQKINQISVAMGISSADLESIKAMFIKATGNAFKILEILPSASDVEVKKAYRIMAKRYHPDKLQSKDPALIKGAQEKFQQVQKAYEAIKKERKL
ncbi:MAG: DnaJ like chaperone protein [Flavobacteriaceae bacterium]|jgi:DnaJ like chaperone protein|tara:strand:- start:11277 stop:11999 length:723 start_codon:yes stop_codon:yes gene_type:complete